ncbi:adenosylcobyric acid synthase (glutamine-hydrolysing) [Chitinophaga niastensis]|uniref:Cobyric acid synthase n=1 Tax=Chitinophaga niastensis TaxID=536980 RepID=A0A2P8HGX5_CHINA|nr:cobyric acid synthase [Chitinophaga niastensis]PSL45469.1 adenosylcobyric acid synthase (glutamine-hydrolysing) [Chitinophaga niastensis]
MKQLRPIMFVGTASDVGKSVITAGFCRIFKQDGYTPAPFKAQNMSLNSYATPDGLEIGRAQAVQAEAAGVPCHTDMNPVLLKPTNDKSSQLVLHGKPAGNQSAWEYFMQNDKRELFEEVKKSFDRLSVQYNPVVMEGAGSISELNLRHRDITNMRIALHADAAVYLIADIDRGGIFGSVYGTIALLPPEEKALIKGIIINKFRGDSRLFEEGRKQLESLTGVPVTGVLPYYHDIHIEEEDSVALSLKHKKQTAGKVNIAVVLLRHMSNFTDFNALEKDERVNVFYTDNPAELAAADIIILPGSKNTIDDLIAIKNNGTARAITEAHKRNKVVIGICGGYQMMGERISDPHGVEGPVGSLPGLGILPVTTVLATEKVTQQRSFRYQQHDKICEGYEIHMGDTVSDQPSPLNKLNNGLADGYFLNSKCWGTYLHGILDNDVVVNDLLAQCGKSAVVKDFDYRSFKEQQYNKLATHIREHLDVSAVYKALEL